MDRREFLKTGGILSAGAACACGLPLLAGCESNTASTEGSSAKGKKWGMVIDLGKCSQEPNDCSECVIACKNENNISSRGDKKLDVYPIRKVTIKREHPAGATGKEEKGKPVPLLCNHCDNPPCAQACPVQATYKRDDGIVIVDHHRCIGCRYCMIACPYNARHFNFKEDVEWTNPHRLKSSHGVPQSCTFCAHLLDGRGEYSAEPACVRECPQRALELVDLNDPEVLESIAERSARGIREDLGTQPNVFYIDL